MSTSNPTTEQSVHDDALGMSDEAFADLDPSVFEQEHDEESDLTEDHDTDADDLVDDESAEDDADQDDADDGEGEDADPQDEASDSDPEDDADAESDGDEDTDSEDDSESDEEEASDEDEKKDESEVDFKSEYEKLMAPFKANGHEMKANNAEEARRLMQMGANYNKKMAALKPSLKTVKLLDKHGLNDEGRLNHLIDLTRGDKGAIQKLLKDSGVDPLDLNSDEENEYRPNTYNVDDREIELDSVLESLQDTPTYNQTLDLVSNKWDDASKQIIANNPRVLEVLNDQMANGVYGRVSTEVERLRAFGQLSDVSDIDAYKTVGDRMAEEGKFADMAPKPTQTPEKPAARRAPAKREDPDIKQKKRAASSTRTKPASKQPSDFNPLGMSDEEFEKQFDSNLM
jgi:hypothetical protein